MIAIAAIAAFFAGLFVYSETAHHQAEAAYPPLGRFVESRGLRLHYLDKGTGPAVVMLHGSNGVMQVFTDTVFDRVAAKHRALVFDRPGFGHSERPNGTVTTPALQAELLREALNRLGVEKPLLVAHSWSAALALNYAVAHGDELAGLVLLSGYVYPSANPVGLMYRVPQWPLVGELLMNTILVPAGQVLGESYVQSAFAPEPVPASFANYPVALTLRASHYRANSEDIRELSPSLRAIEARYRDIDLPIVLVTGDADPVVLPERHSLRLHAELPASRLIVLTGAGHMIPYTRPDAVVDAIDLALQLGKKN